MTTATTTLSFIFVFIIPTSTASTKVATQDRSSFTSSWAAVACSLAVVEASPSMRVCSLVWGEETM